jgi:eukaryotic-like serine/threonine-protein kinase
MSINNVENLLAALRRVQLLGPDQVDEIERELGPQYKNPRTLADYLVQIDWLTSYQVDTLFEGDWDELVIGPFIFLSRLGEGGLSQVYKAWDTHKGRIVAVKVLRDNLASQKDAIRQFRRELKTVAMLAHPNVIKTFDAYRDGDRHFFAMEFVEGTDLDRFVKLSGPLPVEQACDFIRQVAQGLQHAHQLGLVHRDIKPANLFLINPPVQGKQLIAGVTPPVRRSGDPTVKILDWGLARLRKEEGAPADQASVPDSVTMDSIAAEKGLLIGTADYISPEQTCGPTVVDTRSDIYSLGCTFYYLLTGEPPFGSLPLMQKLMAHRDTQPPNIRELRPDVPPEVEHILAKMLSKSPQDRYQIPLLLVAPLRHFCAGTTALVGGLVRPPSAISLARPASGLSLARPASVLNLNRPGSSLNLNKPPSSLNLDSSRNGANGTGHHANGK